MDFTALIATAIGDADARDALARLASEQTALRRVATLVAERTSSDELFAAVAAEVSAVLDVDRVTIDRYDSDASSTVLASLNASGFPVGSRWPHDGPSVGARVLATGRPARVDDYTEVDSSAAAMHSPTPSTPPSAPRSWSRATCGVWSASRERAIACRPERSSVSRTSRR